MMWFDKVDEPKPPYGRPVLCYCPRWCDTGYQAAYWNGKKFEYPGQPNDQFDQCVVRWAIFMEAD